MMTLEEIIKSFTNENGFCWGIDTAMKSLRPGCMYALQAGNGTFEIIDWPDNQWSEEIQGYVQAPTSQEIRDEYIRHKTIAECLEYFNKEKTT